MALHTLIRSNGIHWARRVRVARCCWSSTPMPVAPPSLSTRLLLFFYQRFHDVEKLISWSSWLKTSTLLRKNFYYGYTQRQYGDNVAAAFYILSLKGGFRFAGQSEWFRPDTRGRFSWDFVNFRDLPIEEVDLSSTLITYAGLDNLVSQQQLRTLLLCDCSEVDDWFLSRLHIFQNTLEELRLSGCTRVTVGGLGALQHLRKLRRLDLSGLSRLQNPGLVRILLEELLPDCHITGVDYRQGLLLKGAETDSGTNPATCLPTEEPLTRSDSLKAASQTN